MLIPITGPPQPINFIKRLRQAQAWVWEPPNKMSAERVTDATKENAGLIDNIQKGVAEPVRAVEEGSNEVQEGVKLAEEAGRALEDILGGIEGVPR